MSKKPLKLARLKCKESLVIVGRNPNGEPDQCFEQDKEYLFCYDEKKEELFTYNDVKEVHFIKVEDNFTNRYFEIIAIDFSENFDLDEFNLNRMKKLFKERHSYSE